MMHDWFWGGGTMGAGGMFLGPLFMIVWLAILVAVIVFVLRWLGALPGGNGHVLTARDILDQRFARGEIDHDEYEKRRKAMSG